MGAGAGRLLAAGPGQAGHPRNLVRPGGDGDLVLPPSRPGRREVPGPARTSWARRRGSVSSGVLALCLPARGGFPLAAISADLSPLRRELGSGKPVHAGWRVKARQEARKPRCGLPSGWRADPVRRAGGRRLLGRGPCVGRTLGAGWARRASVPPGRVSRLARWASASESLPMLEWDVAPHAHSSGRGVPGLFFLWKVLLGPLGRDRTPHPGHGRAGMKSRGRGASAGPGLESRAWPAGVEWWGRSVATRAGLGGRPECPVRCPGPGSRLPAPPIEGL